MISITGGQVLLPDGRRVPGVVELEGERIVSVGGDGTQALRGRTVDATGCTVMPGLIDLHSHLTLVPELDRSQVVSRAKVALSGARQAVRALRAGITSCRDIGGVQHVDLALRDAIASGAVPGPRLECAGQFIAITGGHAWPHIREADGEAEVRRAVREQVHAGADFIKFMASGGVGRADESEGAIQFSYPEVAAIVAEARAAGKVATAHAHPEEAIRNSVRAGVRSIEHGTHLTEELAGMMRDQGTFLVPTFAIYRGLASAGRWPELAPRAQHVFDVKVRTFAAAVERGVRWGIGTDAGSFFPPTLIADEIEIIAGLGFSPWEVISQATAGNAELWGWSDVGRLEAGAVADLVVVEGDPLQNLSDVRNVRATVARGTVYDWRVIDADPGRPLLPA
jgi:imidazolonepropionase-like amidohydrolase